MKLDRVKLIYGKDTLEQDINKFLSQFDCEVINITFTYLPDSLDSAWCVLACIRYLEPTAYSKGVGK